MWDFRCETQEANFKLPVKSKQHDFIQKVALKTSCTFAGAKYWSRKRPAKVREPFTAVKNLLQKCRTFFTPVETLLQKCRAFSTPVETLLQSAGRFLLQ